MAAYRADIEIGVKGIQQLQTVTKEINTLSSGIDGVNKRLAGASQSINAYNNNLAKAAANLSRVNAGTIAEADAVRQYVQALGQANAARDRQNRLIQQQIALQRRPVPTANAGFGVQAPALPPTTRTGAPRGGGLGGRISGAVSGSIIGGAFPLLFGQGGAAATGGAIGGLAGGLAGPGGSFAGSLLGTLIGDIVGRGQAIKQLADDIGFSAEQTKQLSDAFKVANTDVEKFTGVIQNIRGVGLEIEDQAKAIQLVTRLTELYGGSFEKTGNAITSALESGKVSQATLNQLSSQGINIQEALATKYGVNRDALLKLAKDGKVSVQDLIDTLVDLGNKSGESAKKQEDVFADAYNQITSAAVTASTDITGAFKQTGESLQGIATNTENVFVKAFKGIISASSEFILGIGEIARVSGAFLDGVTAKFIDIQFGILGAAKNLPVLNSGIINFAKDALAVLNPVGTIIDKIRGAGRARKEQFGPAAPPVTLQQLLSFRAPSQAAPAGGAGARAKAPKGQSDAERLAEELRKSIELGDKLSTQFTRQILLLDAETEIERKRLDIQFDYEDRQSQINELKDAEQKINLTQLNGEIRRLELINLQTEAIKKQAEEADKLFKEAIGNADIQVDPGNAIANFVAESQTALAEFVSPLERVKTAAEAIGTSFSESFRGIITGTQSAQQAISQFFQNIGQALIDYGTTAIAQYIAIGIARLFAGVGSFAGASASLSGAGALGGNIPGLAVGGAASTAGSFTPNLFQAGTAGLTNFAFAEGGFVTGPTNAIIGEGGQPEYVIPASKMSAAMSRYSRGVRGDAVIPGDSASVQSAAPNGAPMEPIDVRYSVERINNVDYVTTDQFQRGLAQAAQQGAIQGERRALRTLSNSPANRRRIGL